MPNCQGCLKELHPVGDAGYAVCLDCTKARHKAVMNRGKCTCTKANRRERTVETAIRCWVACDRCLGKVRNLPDKPIKYKRVG